MKKLIFPIIVIISASYFYFDKHPRLPEFINSEISESNSDVYAAFKNRKSDVQVTGYGTVVKILPDDLKGSRHQKFILKLASGITVLIAHNIDLASRIPQLKKGDEVVFFGEYEWNEKGGVVHWTHHDPNARHLGGWLKHQGTRYQ